MSFNDSTHSFADFIEETGPQETPRPKEEAAHSEPEQEADDPFAEFRTPLQEEAPKLGKSRKSKSFKPVNYGDAETSAETVRSLLTKQEVEFKEKPKEGETVFVLSVCPENENHTGGKAFVQIAANGDVTAGCQKESCKWGFPSLHKKWTGEYPESAGTEGQNAETEEKTSLSKQLVEHAQKICEQFFLDQYGNPCALLVAKDQRAVTKVNSARFRNLLVANFYEAEETAAGDTTLRNAANILAGLTLAKGETLPLHHRVAEHEGALYYDLATPDGKAVRTELIETHNPEEQAFSIQVVTAPILFESRSHAMPQCLPDLEGSIWERIREIDRLRKYVRQVATGNDDLDRKQFYLVVAVIVSYLVPNIARPILWPHGEKGSAKTTLCRIIKRLIDPSALEVAPMRSYEQMVDQLIANHMVVFDNTSTLSNEQSDLLCTAVTGGGVQKRQLYTDSDVVTHKFQRCVAVNGVSVVARNSDLFDRAILLNLERIPEESRTKEAEMWREFEADKPKILGALFTLLGLAMYFREHQKIDAYMRLADFHEWGEAVFQSLGEEAGTFTDVYRLNQTQQNTEFLESDPLAHTVFDWVQKERRRGMPEYEAGVSEFHQKLVEHAGNESGRLPKNAQAMARKLKTMISNFEQENIWITIGRDKHGAKVHIKWR